MPSCYGKVGKVLLLLLGNASQTSVISNKYSEVQILALQILQISRIVEIGELSKLGLAFIGLFDSHTI